MVGDGRVEIADTMQVWLETGAADGFNIMFPDRWPAGLDEFCEACHPGSCNAELSFAMSMRGPRLREHLGLPRPEKFNSSRLVISVVIAT